MAFVGFRCITAAELNELVSNPAIALPSSYYFLRWFHRVSGIQMALPNDFPSLEGQLFNAELELRWKQRGNKYEVLLLSQTVPDAKLNFLRLEGIWECTDRNAYFYDNDETKFPKGFLYQDVEGKALILKEKPLKQVKQRYFRDAQTATVYFVALTI